jgi:hypothetical protein
MFGRSKSRTTTLNLAARPVMSLGAILSSTVAATGATAQIELNPAPDNIGGNQICTIGGTIVVSDTEDGCTVQGQDVQTITFQSGSSLVTANGSSATFNGTANFNNATQVSGTLGVSGTATFTGSFNVQGSSAVFGTPTFFTFPSTFQAPATFNGTTNFTAGMTTTNITNSGSINTSTLNASGSLTVSSGATVNMGNNQIHGVAAGTANTDAVNVGQLNAVTGNVTALQTTVATQSTQISALQTTTATQTTQISALQTTTATHTTQISALQTTTATHTTQISALQAAETSLANDIGTLFDLRSRDRRDMKQGVATAIAIANAPMPSAPGKVSYAVNGARFRGEYAVGGSLMYRLPGDTPFAVNAGFSYAGNKNNGVRLGVAGEF